MDILISGNPVDGFTFVGPFTDPEDATRYAETTTDGPWNTAALVQPDEDECARTQAWNLAIQALGCLHALMTDEDGPESFFGADVMILLDRARQVRQLDDERCLDCGMAPGHRFGCKTR